ncbi:unnamed protein product [Bursaphelenchus okinawaensis]|uniref:Uncharacterized protein n=1 Tax=Bursaphelenchus okinawaensis TaxID=465554 RepID=A0A811LAS4_9BILA|nr:unnamed protein product [Bursaphelenchus okinawaensis]CAG9120098.1 unnamed protein product [Bursaphelenchus okinawaensis]
MNKSGRRENVHCRPRQARADANQTLDDGKIKSRSEKADQKSGFCYSGEKRKPMARFRGGRRTRPAKRCYPTSRYTPRPSKQQMKCNLSDDRSPLHLTFSEDKFNESDEFDVSDKFNVSDHLNEDVDEMTDRMKAVHLWYKTQLLQEQTKQPGLGNKIDMTGRRVDTNGNLI